MGPRRPEMREVPSDYVFDEHGGRGAPASAFFRRISRSNHSKYLSQDASEEVQQKPLGAGFSHTTHVNLPKASHQKSGKTHRRHSTKSYFDLDDDWDANVETLSPRPPREPSPRLARVEEREARAERDELNARISRIRRFNQLLHASVVDLEQLRRLAWSGVPVDLRPRTWMQLLGYIPAVRERQDHTLQRRRQEYAEGIKQAFQGPRDQAMWHQISIDVPRTNPHLKLYSFESTKRSLERILYLWALRHPASGYVQGINDLVTPFFQTFLSQYVGTRRIEDLDPGILPNEQLEYVEADSYWCLTRLLDGIQDNYIHAQPGIHRQVDQLRRLVQRIDSQLVDHLDAEGVGFMQFSFRWMNCLLMRELPLNCVVRLWDAYLSEGPIRLATFHVYVCAAFLTYWSKDLGHKDFQDLMIYLQALPTQNWSEKDVEVLLGQAFMYQSLFPSL